MAKPKALIFRALKPAHLQAIGRVAAEWSGMEFLIQALIAEVAGIDLYKSIILTKSSGFNSWKSMLKNLVSTSYNNPVSDKELTKLFEQIDKLCTERNSIVHATWKLSVVQDGLRKGTVLPPGETAFGVGFPKNGKAVFSPVEKTAKEMRDVANDIVKAREELIDVVHRARLRASQHTQLAQALSESPTQARPNPSKRRSLPAPSRE